MTIAEFCTENNKPRSTVRARWNAAKAKNPTLPAFDITREVDAQTRAIIDPTSRAKPAQKPASSRAKKTANDAQHLRAEVQVFAHDSTRKIEPETAQDLRAKVAQEPRKNDAQETTAKKERRVKQLRAKIRREVARSYAFDIIMAGIAVGHAGLIWYDCASLWNTPGLIGGGLAFLMVIGALVIATDKDKASTSQDAMYFVFVVDCAAGFAHFAVFSKDSTAGFWPTAIFSAFICLCSYVALYLFRNSKNAW